MASKVAPNRHSLLCPVCKKTQAVLSVHLARVCMKTASKDAIQQVVEKAKRDVQDILQWGRIFTYSELVDVLGDVNPRSVIRMIDELERRHMVVSDVPPSLRHKTTSGRVTSQPATTTQPAESQEVHGVSSGESIQVVRDVQHTSRQLMAERGLHKKHPLDHPLLKGFAMYLETDLQNENFKQEVENVSRVMYYMNPVEPSLEFVKEREKTKQFLCELAEAKLSKQTQMNYLKGLKRFLKYHITNTDLRYNDEQLWDECNSFIPFISSLQQSCTKAVSKGIIQRRHAVPTEKGPFTPENCLAVLRAAKSDFLTVIGKVSPRDSPLEMTECCLVLYYLQAIVILKHLQRPGVVEHMTVQEWTKRTRDESGYTVIGVKEDLRSVQQVATFALPLEEEMWFDTYFIQVRPQLLTCKRSRKTQDDMGGGDRFFVSTAGRPICSASKDIHRLHQKYQLNPVSSQTARQAFELASKQMTDSEQSLVADYLGHCAATEDNHMKQSRNVVLASKLLGKLAGDPSDCSADEGPSRGPRGAAWGAPSGPCTKMDARAAYDQLLQTHPVTLDGDTPDRTARSQTSGQFKRQLYERWLKAQRKLRV